MVVSSKFLAFAALIFYFILSPSVQASFRPKSLLLPVTKDASTLQYVTQIKQRTPLLPLRLTLDLGGPNLLVDCEQSYVSSSYKPVLCNSAQCSLARFKTCGTCIDDDGHKPGCNNNSCMVFTANSVINIGTIDEVAQDVVSVQSTDGKNPGKFVSVSNFLFTCGSTFYLRGLASGVKGMAGLGRTKISMPSQFAAAFSFSRKFAVCLSSSSSSNGVIFFGDGPYAFFPNNLDISESLIYTPLILNPVSTLPDHFQGEPSSEYFIGVKGILINGKAVKFDMNLLSINEEGHGGTKISTVRPYTVMETSIYIAVIDAFVKAISPVPRVPEVYPFGACFNATSIGSTCVGPAVPQIDLVLQNKDAVWSIFGANSMVQVSNDVICLGIVDGALIEHSTSVVIGGHQIENNLLQFDLATSRLGFSSSLLFRRTKCANFNFTSNA